MLTCRESAKLISDGLDRKLPLWLRLGLRVHLMMCSACRAYRQQLGALNKLISERFRADWPADATEPQSLSDGARQRIKAALRDQAH
jgi:predicted anti-sigma-YlaC factor YlaD